MDFCITIEEMRKAMKALEECEAHGFKASLAVFRLNKIGPMLKDVQLSFLDTWDMVDGSPSTDWGRQSVAKHYRFEDGDLVSLDPA